MSKPTTINILGTDYTIEYKTEYEDQALLSMGGHCDYTTKKIVIRSTYPEEVNDVEDMSVTIQDTIRHEIVHAFLRESGLSYSSWANNEEIVDWIALQFPKMQEVFKAVEMIALDMDMPKTCYECNFSTCIAHGGVCKHTGNFIEWGQTQRPDWCPLKEIKGICMCEVEELKQYE